MTEAELDKVIKAVMKVVNKHHGKRTLDIANYKRSVSRVENNMRILADKISEFIGDNATVPNKLAQNTNFILEHAIGVQRVYDEFLVLKERIIKLEETE